VLGRIVAMIAGILLVPVALAAQPAVPLAQPGTQFGDNSPASLLHPKTIAVSFRVPASTDLWIAGDWLTSGLSVTIVPAPPGRIQTLIGAPVLPGKNLGVALPGGAWRATRIDLVATTVSAEATIELVTGEQLAYAAASNTGGIALFGFLLALTLLGAGVAVLRRARAPALFALATGAQMALAIPVLGIVRPPPVVSQPLHALVWAVAWIALALLVRDLAGPVSRWATIALAVTVVANIVFQTGSDIGQDFWIVGTPSITAIVQSLLTIAFDVALLAVAMLAVRADVAGGWVLVAATGVPTLAAATITVSLAAFEVATAPALVIEFLILAYLVVLAPRPASVVHARAPDYSIDGLTGLADRPAFDTALEAAWERGIASATPVALLLLNLDHFKRYNDAYGHLAGDDALRRCAGACASALNGEDGALVARYDRDEIAMLLPGRTAADAFALAERVHGAVEALQVLHAEMPLRRLTTSVGVAALVPSATDSPDLLVRRANAALYVAKTMGRNRTVLDEPPQTPEKTESAIASFSA
jgi:diguanylate cyclase (GGDEF)-like protein